MKKLLLASTIAGLSLGLSAPTIAAENNYEAYQASIDERGDSGVSGTAVFNPGEEQVTVVVKAENADGMSAGIHQGICRYAEEGENAPEHVAFKKEPKFEGSSFENGQSKATVDATLDNLMKTPHSLAIYDGEKMVACGNIQ
ncbi:hypothetical protein LV476_03310 [Guyparkeria hydrothermalis]|uniref:hypothetical protein n=1 Tax=Guyparkeria hydrothermalis TaxID=923 RepID=UPI002020EC29|nr:hypothetical protein [Guyparkeria hydrothermalis]MCL7743980.1 hypothetical protein [Guyparkeria hydrothermalis]